MERMPSRRRDIAATTREVPRLSTSLRPAWTDTRRINHSALAELERQRPEHDTSGTPKRYLTWAERQRLVDAPPSPLWPMLLAIGMLWVVSISLTAPTNESELLKILREPVEVPFVPHEAEMLRERHAVVEKKRDLDSDAESDLLLLQRKREFLSRDEGDRLLDWVEKHVTLGDTLLNASDHAVLLKQTPAESAPLVEAVLKQARDLKQQAGGRPKIAILLQEDLAGVAKLILLCRALVASGNLDGEQVSRLMELLRLVAKRFSKEWPEALTLTRYVADARERKLYLRLVGMIASAAEATGSYILADYLHGNIAAAEQAREGLPWKITFARFEIQRLLDEAKFPGEIAEVFRAD